MIISLEKEYNKAMDSALSVLNKGGVLIFPTDTVYGMGCDAQKKQAIERIYKIKKRDGRKPLAVIMANLEMVKEWCQASDDDVQTLIEHLPGPYTFILKLREGKELAGLKGKIGVRVPNYSFVRKLADNFNKPIAATSANLSGGKDTWKLSDIDRKVLSECDIAIDGGETQLKGVSTVVDLVDKKILREGAGEFEFK